MHVKGLKKTVALAVLMVLLISSFPFSAASAGRDHVSPSDAMDAASYFIRSAQSFFDVRWQSIEPKPPTPMFSRSGTQVSYLVPLFVRGVEIGYVVVSSSKSTPPILEASHSSLLSPQGQGGNAHRCNNPRSGFQGNPRG